MVARVMLELSGVSHLFFYLFFACLLALIMSLVIPLVPLVLTSPRVRYLSNYILF